MTDVALKDRAGAGAVLALVMLLGSLGTSIANIALPTLAADFEVPFYQAQWVVISYLAALTLCAVTSGRLGDQYGKKRMLLSGLVIFCAGSFACGISSSLQLLVAARALQGIGAAFTVTLSMALVRQSNSGASVGRALGLLGAMSALGTALGPSLGGLLLSTTGWPGIFLCLVPLGIAAFVLVIRILPDDSGRNRGKPGSRGWSVTTGMLQGMACNFLVAGVMMTTLVVGPFYLSVGLGLDSLAMGLAMTVGPALSIVAGVPLGHGVDRWGTRRAVLAGLGAMGIGSIGLAVLPQTLGLLGYLAAIAVLTPGYQLFQAGNAAATMEAAGESRRGTAAGLLGLSRNLGLILGASVMGAVFALGAGTAELAALTPAAVGGGLQLVFALASIMVAVAFWLSWKSPSHSGLRV
ncbi:MAG: transporter [Devosia sp.]|nr:transporter [Devosia sp.]